MSEIRNAIIESTKLDIGERGCLTAWLYLDYGGSGQGFGGYALHIPKGWKHHCPIGPAGHFIQRCLEVTGVTEWDELIGKTIRVDCEQREVHGIGHIVKDDWFYPSRDFETLPDVSELMGKQG